MQVTYANKDLIDKYKLAPLTKKITRKISYHIPDSSGFEWPDKVQEVVFHRIADVNTNNPSDTDYGVWTAEKRPIWPEVVSPKSDGYKADSITVPRVVLEGDEHNEYIDVTYTPVSEEAKQAFEKSKKEALENLSTPSDENSNDAEATDEAVINQADNDHSTLGNNLFSAFNSNDADNKQTIHTKKDVDEETPQDDVIDDRSTTKQLDETTDDQISSTSQIDESSKPQKDETPQEANDRVNEEKETTDKRTDSDQENAASDQNKGVFGPSKDLLKLIPYKNKKTADRASDSVLNDSDELDNNDVNQSEDQVISHTQEESKFPVIDKANNNPKVQKIRSDYERNFAHLADMHSRPIILSNEYAHLREDPTVASVIHDLAQTGEIDYVPVRHNWDRVDYDWGGLFE